MTIVLSHLGRSQAIPSFSILTLCSASNSNNAGLSRPHTLLHAVAAVASNLERQCGALARLCGQLQGYVGHLSGYVGHLQGIVGHLQGYVGHLQGYVGHRFRSRGEPTCRSLDRSLAYLGVTLLTCIQPGNMS